MYTDSRKLPLDIDFVMARIVFIASCRIGHHRNRKAQIFFQLVLIRHIRGHFAEHIVIVPRIDKSHVFAAVAQRAHDQIDRDDFTEVPDMHGTRRRYARSAGI